MKLDFRTTDDGTTLELIDQIERRQVALRFPSFVSLSPADAETFVYPVDRAVAVRTATVTVEPSGATTVLNASGEVQTQVGTASLTAEVPPGEYYLDVSSHVKTYLRVSTSEPMSIEVDVDQDPPSVDIDFGAEIEVTVGGRSVHEHPEATITTTPAPADVMTAVSYLGSALKDLGPGRSFPSLRGHPPEIELGDELNIPDELTRPETGVSIEVPPAYEYVFPIVPLAYYLGASVVPGDRPRVVTDEGFEQPLDGPEGFELTVERVLKQVFTCDCFVRAAGPISVPLARQAAFEADTGIDSDDIYDRPLAEQLATYLAAPFEAVEPYVPEWGVAAHLEATPESIEHLPFLAKALAVVRSPAVCKETLASTPSTAGASQTAVAASELYRSAAMASAQPPAPGSGPAALLEPAGPSIGDTTGVPSSGGPNPIPKPTIPAWPGTPPRVVWPAPLDAQEQLWIAHGIPIGTNEPILHATRNALDRDPVDEIEVLVVCNDDRMIEEDNTVRDLLGARTPFNVRIRSFRNLETDQLRELLSRGADVLHYIGHIDERGFACSDGMLDATTLEEVNVDTFFLNACQSHVQGRALIDAGAIAGVVTLADVRNCDAARTGRTMARLLNHGFPFNSALRLASEQHDSGDQYTVLGEGSLQITQADNFPQLMHVDPVSRDAFDTHITGLVTPQSPLGSVFAPNLDGIDGWFLTGDTVSTRVTSRELREFLAREGLPVRVGDSFSWSTDVAEQLASVLDYTTCLEEATDLASRLAALRPDPFEDVSDVPEGYEETMNRLRDLEETLAGLADDLDLGDYRLIYRLTLTDDH